MVRYPLLMSLLLGIAALASTQLLAQLAVPGSPDDAQAAPATPPVANTVLSVFPASEAPLTPQPVLVTTSVADLLLRYLTAEAQLPGQPPGWSGHIRDVGVGLHTATVRTDLGDSPAERAIAEQIAGAVVRFSASPLGQGLVAPDVDVLSAGQQPLASRPGSRLAREVPRH